MTEVLVEKRRAVQWITINREERRNAMNDSVVAGISAVFAAATDDPEVRAVVLTGAGTRAFCAGADLSAGSGSFQYDYSKTGLPFVRLMKQARDLTLPLIARVNGHAMAGGLGMLGMCDMAVAVETATFGMPEAKAFGMPEAKVGIFPMQIMAVLQRLIPSRKLYEMALTGEPISAAEALEIGLLNYVVPAAELDAKLDWLLNRLLDKSPTAIRRGKYAMRATEDMTSDQIGVFMEGQIGTLALTEDAAEGRRAFIEKRKPNWPGR
jgi:methylglutaconyl-CoA hydratase